MDKLHPKPVPVVGESELERIINRARAQLAEA